MKKRFSFFLLLPILFTGCAYFEGVEKTKEFDALFSVEWNNSVGKKISNLSYDDGDFHSFDLYLPADSSNPKSKHMIMFIHGGSWQHGSKNDGEKYCKYFTSKGYVTSSINYTLQDENHKTSIPLINEEVKKAVAAIKISANDYGYPLNDMAVFGYSAGGCQAMLFAFKEKNNSAIPIKFVIDMSGPVIFDPSYWTKEAGVFWYEQNQLGLDGSAKKDAEFVSLFSGKKVTEQMMKNGEGKKIWQEISPITYVDENTVPVIIIFGVYDGLVVPKHHRLLRKTLEEKSVAHKCFELPNSGHSVVCDNDKIVEFQKTALNFCDKYFK